MCGFKMVFYFRVTGQTVRDLFAVGGAIEETPTVQAARVNIWQCKARSRPYSSRHK